jgi:hypothetical protein
LISFFRYLSIKKHLKFDLGAYLADNLPLLADSCYLLADTHLLLADTNSLLANSAFLPSI